MRIIFPYPARVIADYQAAYPNPLILAAGEAVQTGRRDPEFPGWVWSTNRAGQSAWVPENILDLHGETAVARQGYSSAELTVRAGEQITLLKFERGWFWASNSSNQSGWVPEKVIGL
jgi:hypothetical protein